MENQEYMNTLREQYEQYGDFAFLEGKIQAFIKAHRYNVTSDEVRKDLEKIVKWNELKNEIPAIDNAQSCFNTLEQKELEKTKKWNKLKNEIPTIDNVQSYFNALELFCTEFGSDMSSLDMRTEFVKTFQLDTKFQIDSTSVGHDIIHLISKPQKFLKGDNRQLYLELLKHYYENYGDNMFYSKKIEQFKMTCFNHNLNILSYDIAEDLREIRKTTKSAIPNNATSSSQKQNKQKTNTVNTSKKKTTTPKQSANNKPKQTTANTYYNYTSPKQTTTNTYYTPPKSQVTKTPQNYNKALGILGREAGKSLGNVLLSIANEVMKSL